MSYQKLKIFIYLAHEQCFVFYLIEKIIFYKQFIFVLTIKILDGPFKLCVNYIKKNYANNTTLAIMLLLSLQILHVSRKQILNKIFMQNLFLTHM